MKKKHGKDPYIPKILACIYAQAKSNSVVFAEAHGADGPKTVMEATRHASDLIFATFGSKIDIVNMCKPNRHFPEHHAETVEDYGSCVNMSAVRFETKHGVLRAALRHCNHRWPEVSMMERHNVMQALLFLADGGECASLDDKTREWMTNDDVFRSLLKTSYSTTTYAEMQSSEQEIISSDIAKKSGVFIDIETSELASAYLNYYHVPIVFENTTIKCVVVTSIQLQGREKYASCVIPGSFYRITSVFSGAASLVGRVEYAFCHVLDTGKQTNWLVVQLYATHGQHADLYPILVKAGAVFICPPSAIIKPIHVVVREGVLIWNDLYFK
jgi:hypothetical protein